MYIVAIGWMFVVVCMTVVEATTSSVIGGIGTLFLYGILPLGLFLWLFGSSQRRRGRAGGKPPVSGASFDRGRGTGPRDDDQ